MSLSYFLMFFILLAIKHIIQNKEWEMGLFILIFILINYFILWLFNLYLFVTIIYFVFINLFRHCISLFYIILTYIYFIFICYYLYFIYNL